MTFFKAVFYFIILILPTQFLSASTPVDILYSSDTPIAGFQFNRSEERGEADEGYHGPPAGLATAGTGGGAARGDLVERLV